MLRILSNSLLLLWLSFMLAAVIQMHRPADIERLQGLDAPTARTTTAPVLLDRMEQAVFRRNAELQITEAEANRYLASVLEGRQAFTQFTGAHFERLALDFEANECRVLMAWNGPTGRQATASLDFTIDRRGEQFIIEPRNGAYGRLPLPRGMMCALLPSLKSLTKGLDVEIYTLFQMNKIRFEKDRLILDPRSEALK
ncbi:MAG: hypothetical protein ACAI34_20120 [Verrucomicrobium sp.]|nr:hypothetical protein [Verrucomicrobium sp.]